MKVVFVALTTLFSLALDSLFATTALAHGEEPSSPPSEISFPSAVNDVVEGREVAARGPTYQIVSISKVETKRRAVSEQVRSPSPVLAPTIGHAVIVRQSPPPSLESSTRR